MDCCFERQYFLEASALPIVFHAVHVVLKAGEKIVEVAESLLPIRLAQKALQTLAQLLETV